ncbi:PepSY domain-containing protein [Rhizobium sp. SL42]|uniref:PepSY domain-containing protein n=1 Tax=Rhizobium sp. SL42 TaxID=2806346 RepID=UPI001F214189|nr:PepSY domain-containing protein [Rhizobium sp. SL42]UJW77451.1 PepSY domain-containing protein [Rhizobium sp. SL42]
MKLLLVTILGCHVFAGFAVASGKCNVPLVDWQPRKALQARLEGAGWTLRSIRSKDGCYLVDAVNEKGEPVNAQFDPKSFVTLDISIQP